MYIYILLKIGVRTSIDESAYSKSTTVFNTLRELYLRIFFGLLYNFTVLKVIVILNYYLDEDSYMALYSKRMKIDTENRNLVLTNEISDLVRDAHDFEENIENKEQYKSADACLKE